MDQFLEPFKNLNDFSTSVTILKAIVSICLSFVLGFAITVVYRKTHHGHRYSQSFVHTIIIMGVVVSVIMIVIGNNMAVAFGLVGAFSIIRFRSAMSDPKDIAFIFFSMAAGIACGLAFYLLAIAFTVTLSAFIYILYILNYGQKQQEKTLKITVPENLHYDHLFDDILQEHLEHYSLIEVGTTNLGTMIQLEYAITAKKGGSDKLLIDAIRERNANLKVSITLSGINV
jgi:uncharacterized membrane protein YhiD involved in acid resistance